MLFHHDPTHDDGALARVLDEARGLFPASLLAIEGARSCAERATGGSVSPARGGYRQA